MSSHENHLLLQEISKIVDQQGFDHFGVTHLSTPVSMAFYENWIDLGWHGDMTYLKNHIPQKKSPNLLLAEAKSAIVVCKNYVPHPRTKSPWPLESEGSVARYAQGYDYHHFFKAELKAVADQLKIIYPNDEFLVFTDSGPVLERDLARKADLGWVGKNTCLIHKKKGSFFFIGEVYTTLSAQSPISQYHDHCGRCRRCIDACPTGALKDERQLDARLCISYLTIESRKIPDIELRKKMGHWLFGCDICQTVCPWNIKIHGTFEPGAENESRTKLMTDLKWILSSSSRSLQKAFYGTPLLRAGSFGLKKNALIVAANLLAYEILPEIQALIEHPKLGELAKWTQQEISQSTSSD